MVIRHLLILGLLLAFLPTAAASGYPNVTLVSPANGNATTLDNITFICNASDDENVNRISFYHDMNGTFGLYDTKRIMELDKDSNTTLLCRFDDSYICEGGEEGTNTSTELVASKFFKGVMINDSDTLIYQTSNNILYNQGTIEFWLKIGLDSSYNIARLFSAGSELQIYADDGDLCFKFHDGSINEITAYSDISTWSEGEWHHLAGIWDVYNLVGSGKIIDLFLDGSNDSVLYSGDFYSYGTFGDYMYVGSDEYGNDQANSTFDEFRISDIPRTPAEINASYMKGAGNHSKESVNWTITNIPDGTYTWNCLVWDNESLKSWNSENYTFSIDTTPPTFNEVNLSPSSADDIDPGVTINVTANITDFGNVSAAIFQYKYDVEWMNVTMDSISDDSWNASFTTISSERVYYYKIWSNDTFGHSNTSQTFSVNVSWDYSWNRNPSLIDAYGLVNSISDVGIITVNNTGDDTLIITLTDDWRPLLNVYYNTTEQFAIAGKSVIDINVTAEYASLDSAKNMTITMSAEPSAPEKTASPTSLNTIATMNSYSGGPYPHVNIAMCPVSVTQSTTGVNLSATVKNIGNETAEDVWFNWTLPYGWANTSGNVNVYIGNVTSKSTNTSDLVVKVSSSAPSGISAVCVNASGKGNLSSSDCEFVQVSCSNSDGVCGAGCTYLTDGNCEAPSNGGGETTYIGIGAVIIEEPKLEISLPERIDLIKGESGNLSIEVTNPVERTNLTGITVQITGYPATLVEMMPSAISNISFNQTRIFRLTIGVPPYIEEKDYFVSVTVLATGTYSGGTKYLEKSGKMIFAVHGVVESATIEAIENAERSLERMREYNFTYIRLLDMLDDAKRAYAGLNFDLARELAQRVVELEETAFRIFSLIGQFEKDTEEAEQYGMDIEEAKRMRELAISAFQRGDYERAEDRITAAVTAFKLETKMLLPLKKMIMEYWPHMLSSIILLSILGFFAKRRLQIRTVEKKLKKLRDAKQSVIELVKSGEDEYFNKGKISKLDYTINRENYEKRLAELGAEELKLITKAALARGRGREDSLLREKAIIEKRLKDAQLEYFVLGKKCKGDFKRTIKELQSELAEIEKNLSKIRKPTRIKGTVVLFSLLGIVLVLSNLSISQALENATAESAGVYIEQAEVVVGDMKNAGLGTERANHTLENARILLSRGDYELALTTARYVPVIMQKGLIVDTMIDDTELKIHELSSRDFDVSKAEGLFLEGVKEFELENYEGAETLLGQAMDMLDKMESEYALSKAATWNPFPAFVQAINENWILISVSVFLLTSVSSLLFLKIVKIKKVRKIESLEMELKSLRNSIIKTQEEYFHRKCLSKKDYEIRMEEYKSGLGRVMEALATERGGKG
ncbi:MAG: hypothetical protein JXC85_05040 [Candidatus Aenigmarchaeota archaeon]|nr:hypothetical protein [Candidatus Aenigmarchaeota archaeon]